MKNRLEEFRKKAGLTRAALSEKADVGLTTVVKIERGERGLTQEMAEKLAAHLDCTAAELMFSPEELGFATIPPSSQQKIPVIGEVQAGTWRESVEMPKDDWTFVVPEITNNSYPGIDRFGLKVVGPSMDRKMPEGYIAICIKYMDIDQEPEDGDYVVVYRDRHGLIEATIKQYRINGRLELWPLSHHPDHQEPLIPEEEAEKGDTITIHAKVIQVMADL